MDGESWEEGDPIWINNYDRSPTTGLERKIVRPGIVVRRLPSWLQVREWRSVQAMLDGERGRRRYAAFRDVWRRDGI